MDNNKTLLETLAAQKQVPSFILNGSRLADYFDFNELDLLFNSINLNVKGKTRDKVRDFFYGKTNILRHWEYKWFMSKFANSEDYTESYELFSQMVEKVKVGTVVYYKLPDDIYFQTEKASVNKRKPQPSSVIAYEEFETHLKNGTLTFRGDNIVYMRDIMDLYNGYVAKPTEGVPNVTYKSIGNDFDVTGVTISNWEYRLNRYIHGGRKNKSLFYKVNKDLLRYMYGLFIKVLALS